MASQCSRDCRLDKFPPEDEPVAAAAAQLAGVPASDGLDGPLVIVGGVKTRRRHWRL